MYSDSNFHCRLVIAILPNLPDDGFLNYFKISRVTFASFLASMSCPASVPVCACCCWILPVCAGFCLLLLASACYWTKNEFKIKYYFFNINIYKLSPYGNIFVFLEIYY
jgi:hypothetical protein